MLARFVILAVVIASCSTPSTNKEDSKTESMVLTKQSSLSLDIQGHRGCRGLLPENSIEGFIKAVELGVTTLEMDVVISKDDQVVVSHETYMSAEICLDSLGREIGKEKAEEYNIYQMTYEQIRLFDCGSRVHSRFPEQQNIKTRKPLLAEVIDSVEQYVAANQLKKVFYNIEIKSNPGRDGIYHPQPEKFAQLVLALITDKEIKTRTNIQSFDVRSLQEARKQAPDITLALLIGNQLSARENIETLGFKPDIYSPNYELINDELIQYLKQEEIKLIPWTINEKADMQRIIDIGVDGIITDYPDRAMEVLKEGI